jgi:hypothetical protein
VRDLSFINLVGASSFNNNARVASSPSFGTRGVVCPALCEGLRNPVLYGYLQQS